MDNHAGNFNDNSFRWLGGLIDSDGCFSISKSNRKNGKIVYTPSITITNKNERMIEYVHNLLDEFNVNHHIKKNGSCKNLVVSRPTLIIRLCELLEGKILVKNKEFELIRDFCKCRIDNVIDKGCNWKAQYTNEELMLAESLRNYNAKHYRECVELGITDSIPQLKTFNMFSFYWLAGFTDGDGCLTINKIKRPNGTFQYQPMIHIVTGSPIAKNIISNFLDRYNINYYLKKQLPGKKHKPNCKNKKFEFYIRSIYDCISLGKLLDEKLVGKLQRCKWLIEFCESRSCRKNKPYDNNELILHEKIKQNIKDSSTTTRGTPFGEDIV
jgi:hypothetical protein